VTRIGSVGELVRYPVKSMLGEKLERVNVLMRGLAGDRVCALIDEETGKVASAKLPRRWRRLLECAATFRDDSGAVDIVMPDGRRLDPSDGSAADALSGYLERRVKVAFARAEGLEVERAIPEEVVMGGDGYTVLEIGMAAPEGGFFDAVPIHFLTTASLMRVAEHSLTKAPEAARFRPNIVIDSVGIDAFAENGWSGAEIAIGRDLRLSVLFPTPRCALPTLAHGALAPDPRLTLEIAKLNKAEVLDMGSLPCLGAYARIERAGKVAIGDDVYLN